MAYTAHTIAPSQLNTKLSSRLKTLCNSWTKIAEDEYIVHHASALNKNCPLCQEKPGDVR